MSQKQKSDNIVLNTVLTAIKYNDGIFSLEALNPQQRYNMVYNFLKSIVDYVGCHSYLFVLCITRFEERYGKVVEPILFEILNPYCNFADNDDAEQRDVAFAAYYALGHHFYRNHDEARMRCLLPFKQAVTDGETIVVKDDDVPDKWTYGDRFVNDYPLLYELLCKYRTLKRDYLGEFNIARLTDKKLSQLPNSQLVPRGSDYKQLFDGEKYVGNIGVNIAYSGAVCAMLENVYSMGLLYKQSQLDAAERQMVENIVYNFDNLVCKAYDYITYAINYNPEYPKYYYLRAKLCYFYRRIHSVTCERGVSDWISAQFQCGGDVESARNAAFKYIGGDSDGNVFVQKILDDIAVAKQKENRAAGDYARRIFVYESLENQVKSPVLTSAEIDYYRNRDKIIKFVSKPEPQDISFIRVSEADDPYVFISYSSVDYKSVYCDLLEMNRRRIRFWFDKDTLAGKDWSKTVTARIKNCACVVFYMSQASITSGAVLRELDEAYKLGKRIITIDLSGNKIVSRLVANVDKSASQQITSDVLEKLVRVLPDSNVVIGRSREPQDVYHINKLYDDLKSEIPVVIDNVRVEAMPNVDEPTQIEEWKSCKTYDGKPRPYEDYLAYDEKAKVFVVADGITRSNREYSQFCQSVSAEVSKVFCQTIKQNIIDTCFNGSVESPEKRMLSAFKKANDAVARLLKEPRYAYAVEGMQGGAYVEPAGCVVVAAFIIGDKLYFGGIGDCTCVLIRNGHRIVLFDKQTEYAFHKLDVETQRKKLYDELVCKDDYGYGVVNGNVNAYKYFAVSHIRLEAGDVVYLMSDGISDAVMYGNPAKIADYSPSRLKEEVCQQYLRQQYEHKLTECRAELNKDKVTKTQFEIWFSQKYGKPFADWFDQDSYPTLDDDKAVIKITFGN